jgi:hypothetical protein
MLKSSHQPLSTKELKTSTLTQKNVHDNDSVSKYQRKVMGRLWKVSKVSR